MLPTQFSRIVGQRVLRGPARATFELLWVVERVDTTTELGKLLATLPDEMAARARAFDLDEEKRDAVAAAAHTVVLTAVQKFDCRICTLCLCSCESVEGFQECIAMLCNHFLSFVALGNLRASEVAEELRARILGCFESAMMPTSKAIRGIKINPKRVPPTMIKRSVGSCVNCLIAAAMIESPTSKSAAARHELRLGARKIRRVLKQVDPCGTITKPAREMAATFLSNLAERVALYAKHMNRNQTDGNIDAPQIYLATRVVLCGRLAQQSTSEGVQAVAKYTSAMQERCGRRESASMMAGLQFPVLTVQRFVSDVAGGAAVTVAASVYLAAVLECVLAKIVELGGNHAHHVVRRYSTWTRITLYSLMLSIINDEELMGTVQDIAGIPTIFGSFVDADGTVMLSRRNGIEAWRNIVTERFCVAMSRCSPQRNDRTRKRMRWLTEHAISTRIALNFRVPPAPQSLEDHLPRTLDPNQELTQLVQSLGFISASLLVEWQELFDAVLKAIGPHSPMWPPASASFPKYEPVLRDAIALVSMFVQELYLWYDLRCDMDRFARVVPLVLRLLRHMIAKEEPKAAVSAVVTEVCRLQTNTVAHDDNFQICAAQSR